MSYMVAMARGEENQGSLGVLLSLNAKHNFGDVVFCSMCALLSGGKGLGVSVVCRKRPSWTTMGAVLAVR